jgi:hypothetical protein
MGAFPRALNAFLCGGPSFCSGHHYRVHIADACRVPENKRMNPVRNHGYKIKSNHVVEAITEK